MSLRLQQEEKQTFAFHDMKKDILFFINLGAIVEDPLYRTVFEVKDPLSRILEIRFRKYPYWLSKNSWK
jgi:hypothetical protein